MIGNVQWTIHKEDEIKPELRGELIYVVELPETPDAPALRHVVDPKGTQFPSSGKAKLSDESKHRTVVFEGVNKAAVYEVMLADPPLFESALEEYNRNILKNCEAFFLESTH